MAERWASDLNVIERLHAARQIAQTCLSAAFAAPLNIVSPDAHKFAHQDCARFKQHVELWFARWDSALQEFDTTLAADLWERIEFAARDLGPVEIKGFHFATAFEAARQSLQWFLNLRGMWERDERWLEPTERCLALLDMAKQLPWPSPSIGIEARIVRECCLALAGVEALPSDSKTPTQDDAVVQVIRSDAGNIPAGRSQNPGSVQTAKPFDKQPATNNSSPVEPSNLTRRFRDAYLAAEHAKQKLAEEFPLREKFDPSELYKWLKKNLPETLKGLNQTTWCKYVIDANRLVRGESKTSPRGGRGGRSIVSPDGTPT